MYRQISLNQTNPCAAARTNEHSEIFHIAPKTNERPIIKAEPAIFEQQCGPNGNQGFELTLTPEGFQIEYGKQKVNFGPQ